jgi:hypothetical protein
MQVDPRVYDTPVFPEEPPAQATAAQVPYVAPEPVSQQSILVGTSGTAQANLTLQENRREGVTWNQSLAAATDEMTPWSAWRHFSGPNFEAEQGFNAAERISSLDTQLDETDRGFLMEAQSSAELEYKIDSMQRSRINMRQVGDNPWIGYTAMAFDPGYLAIDMLSAGAGHIAAVSKAGRMTERLAAGLTAAGGATALGYLEGQSRPMSDAELITNGLINGAAAGVFYSSITRRLEKTDPDFPDAALRDIAQPNGSVNKADTAQVLKVQEEIPLGRPIAPEATPVYHPPGTSSTGHKFEPAPPGIAQSAKAELQRMANDPDPLMANFAKRMDALMGEDVPMGTVAGLKNSEYSVSGRTIGMRADATNWERMHEIAHALTADRLRFGRTNPNTTIGGLAKQIDDLRAVVVQATKGKDPGPYGKYFLKNTDEFMAGLYSGDKQFYEFLKAIPTPRGSTVLNTLVQTVRKMLGISAKDENALTKALGLTDDLMAQPLKVEPPLPKGAVPTDDLLKAPHMNDAEQVQAANAIAKNEETRASKLGNKISWSLHKTLASFGPKGKEIADLLVDDPINMTGDSVVSQTRAIRADLATFQYAYEDGLKAEMARGGFGTMKRIANPRKALKAQQAIERQVMNELWGREQAGRTGKVWQSSASPEIRKMADNIDKQNAAALGEMKAAGVKGAEDIAEKSGYVSRKWDISKLDTMEQALQAGGYTEKAAKAKIHRMLMSSLRRANGWNDELSGDIAKALLDRTRRKGYFEDSAFRSHAGNEALAEIRDVLQGANLRGERLQRALDVIAGKVDEAGKSPVLKHRVELDMKAGISMPDGSFATVGDLLNTDLARIQEQYLDHVAGRSALARKGIGDTSAQGQLKADLMHSIKAENVRKEASDLFDQVMNSILGNPVGEDMPVFLRNSQAITRMVGLASSGLWQVTEFAPAMARYGALRTLGYMFRELPGAQKLFQNAARDGSTATQLHSILTRNASADIRLRPFVQRMEDNFDIAPSAHVTLALNQAQQLVPYLNGQKFVQTKQARVVANLVVDSLEKAARGDKRAMAAWEQYGLKAHIMVELSEDLKKAGTDTAKWTDGTWEKVRGPLTKAMDDAVLRNRTGEIPAFAQFSQVGKFIFTFRSFVLGAHNKVLAGSLGREGFAGLGLVMLYQMPLAMLATAANATIQNKPIKDEQDLVTKAFGQMGSFGLFSEAFGVISGQKQQFGAPGLIAIDRLYKTVGQAAQGNWDQAASAGISATPILSIIPGLRAIGEAFKE